MGPVWENLYAGFWFVPAVFASSAVVLFFVTQGLDQATATSLTQLPVVFSGGPTAARAVLSTIAGSLITVIATLFSLTVVTLQLASSNYTPRILRNFTEDRGMQTVLGVYIATFLYSLLVLRIIRAPGGEGASFNPVISVTVAVVLALVCVALLIYFIAHVIGLIQSSTIVGKAHEAASETIAGLDDLSDAPDESETLRGRPELAGLLAGEPLVIRARESGYVQHLDTDAIAESVAHGRGAYVDDGDPMVVAEVLFGPGFFVSAGIPIVKVWSTGGLRPEDEKGLHGAFYLGKERSFRQDFAFGLRQLSDIALKGLSPAVNDPTTAMQAMDRMEAIFVALGAKALPPRVRETETGGTRVILEVGRYGFEDVVGLAFDQVRRAAFTSGQVAVLERLLEILGRAILSNPVRERRLSLWARAYSVARLAPEQVSDPEDAANLVLGTVKVGVSLLGTDHDATVRSDLEELASASEGLRGGERVRDAVRAALDLAGRKHGSPGRGAPPGRLRPGDGGGW